MSTPKILKRAWLAPVLVLLSVVSAFAQNGDARFATTISGDGKGRSIATFNGPGVPQSDPSHHLVHFKRGAPKNFIPGSGQTRAFPGDGDLLLVTTPPGLSVAESVRRYKANPNVEYAEPDYIVQAVATTPNDTLWTQQWDMTRIGADLAWDTQTNASDVVVAIIDSGIDFSHPDLQANLWVNPADNTSHGFTCMGTCIAGGVDDFGHGTHVAGTIGAVGNNALGIAGVNWQVKLLSMKFIGASGFGQISDAILAFHQVLALKQQGINIRVTNNSWGGGGFSQALKDAMASVEAAGIVDVCAAGNTFSNVDSAPEYPAAYDNRGIISVLATDATDVGAVFTSFGLANVDIAAPGVNTLSTVPSGACPLCDATGYRLLSGTSMATPHVSGVVAALLHQRPGLSAAEARDIVLDPASYDPLADAKARSTSSGGRLNFPRTLANPRLFSPVVLNNFPTITVGPDVVTDPGNLVTLTATPGDADPGDVAGLRLAASRPVSVLDAWLFSAMISQVFPSPTPGSTSFTAPSLARVASVPYQTSVADNRGGGAIGLNHVTTNANLNPGGAPFGRLAVTNPNPAVGETVTFINTAIDPEQHPTIWAISAFGLQGGNSFCCNSGVTQDMRFTSAMAFRVKAQTIDPELQLSDDPGLVVRVGGAKGDPPLAKILLDKLSGPVPFTVNIDMTGSTSPAGAIQFYAYFCDLGSAVDVTSPHGTCTYTTPGPHWLPVEITDVAGQSDIAWSYIVATPASAGADTTPPTVAVGIPSEGETVTGTATLLATASDASGIIRVEFHLDSPGGPHLGTSASTPYFITWDTTVVTPGAHRVYAVARDGAGNLGTSAARNIIVKDSLAPTVTLTSPAAGNVVGKVLLTATASDLSGIAEVQYHLDSPSGALLGASTTGPSHSATWDSTASAGAHTLYAVARDGAGNIGASAGVAIVVIVRPAISITSPLNGSLVDAKKVVTIAAALTNAPTFGIARVDILVDGVLTCSDTIAPYTCDWTVRPGANKTYQLQAIGYDSTNAPGPASIVSVTSRDAVK